MRDFPFSHEKNVVKRKKAATTRVIETQQFDASGLMKDKI